MQKNSLLKKIEEQSLAIRTPVLPEVKDTIESIKPDFDSVKKYKTNIIKWLKPVIDLTGYNVYPRNGITEGLDWWYNREKRGVNMREGDYQWVSPKDGEGKIAYISLPSAKDGNIDIGPKKCPIALDLAYVGSHGKGQKIDLEPDVAFYSLSKSFGIRNISSSEIPFLKKNSSRIKIFWAKDKVKWDFKKFKKMISGKTVYLTFDVDGFDSSIMPATGTPEPGGLFWDETLDIIKIAAKNSNIVGADINELSPIKGFNSYNFLVAKLAYKILSYKFLY